MATDDGFVPQGLVVRGRTAWLSGGDADTSPRTCVVVRVDLRTGVEQDRATPGGCFHGGGLAADRHGLWLVDTRRLLLLDPDSLEVRRSWRLAEPLRGSFATAHAGRLGVGRWLPRRRGTLDWLATDALVASTAEVVTARDVVGSVRTPPRAQGAVVLDGDRPWFARSVTRCGVLVAPDGRRHAFVPGAEGMDRVGDTLWVVSESGSAYVQAKGGRPQVPTIVRLDLDAALAAGAPDCRA